MNTDQGLVKSLFDQVIELEPQRRSSFLDQECAGNADLRAQVEALLQAYSDADSFLESAPHADLDRTLLRPMEAQPGAMIGRYKLLQQIGEGGFGLVYMAEQREPVRRKVALKLIKPGMDTRQVIARFEAERQALAMLDHPNVAKVLDAGSTDAGRPYFVMELVKGIPITSYCDEHHLTTRQRLDLFIPVCLAVQHAHMKGIIHRDIKPSNILVTLHDGVPVSKVIDFGIAKATQQELTQKTLFTEYGQFIGTPAYMSPEQAELSGLDVDTRTDIYSLGVLLYEMLVGCTPFDVNELLRGGYDEIRRRIKEEQPAKPSTRVSSLVGDDRTTTAKQRSASPDQLTKELRGDLDWIILKTLEKDRTRRYESASALAEDVRRHLADEPVSAAAPSVSYRVRTFVRRNKAAVTVAATIAGLLAATTFISTFLGVQAVRARNGERNQRVVAEEREQQAIQASKKLRQANDELRIARDREQALRISEEALRKQTEREAYSNRMLLSQSDWEQGNIRRLEQSLRETADFPDLGFEWYHWQTQLRQDSRTIPLAFPAFGEVNLVAQGDQLLVRDPDQSYLLDSASGEIRNVYPRGEVSANGRWLANRHAIVALVTGDRTKISIETDSDLHVSATSSADGTLLLFRLWSRNEGDTYAVYSKTGEMHYALDRDPQIDRYDGIDFSPDGQWIAALARSEVGSAFKLWQADTGQEVDTINFPAPREFAFSPDSSRLAVLHDSARQIDLFEMPDLTKLGSVTTDGNVQLVAFSPDNTRLAMCTDVGVIYVKEIEDAETIATFRGHRGRVDDIAVSRDGRHVITMSGSDSTVKYWPMEADFIRLHDHQAIRSIEYSRDGNRLLAQTNANAYLIDVPSKSLTKTFSEVALASIFPDGKRVASVHQDEDGVAQIVITDEAGQQRRLAKLQGDVGLLQVHPDSRRITVGTRNPDSRIAGYDVASGTPVLSHDIPDGVYWVGGDNSPDGSITAISGRYEISFYDSQSGDLLRAFDIEEENASWMEFSSTGQRFLIIEADIRDVVVYDVATGKRVISIPAYGAVVKPAHFSPDERRIFTLSLSGGVRVWDASTGVELLSISESDRPDLANVSCLAVSPSGKQVAVGGRGVVWFEEAATEEQVAKWSAEEISANSQYSQWWSRLGGIQEWLLLAPIPIETTPQEAVHASQAPNESALQPREGETLNIAGRDYEWQHVVAQDPYLNILDIESFVGENHDRCAAYAVTYIISDAPHNQARMLIGSDDFAKIYLNGNVVYEYDKVGRPIAPGEDVVTVELKRGRNTVLFKVVDDVGEWGACLQVVGEDYEPLSGVTFSTNPDF